MSSSHSSWEGPKNLQNFIEYEVNKLISQVKIFYLRKKAQRAEFLLSAGQTELEWADTRDPDFCKSQAKAAACNQFIQIIY